ncbi:MAG: DUF350 domain-containing protein [Candidatus Poribacteria bacterium]|nr:DUF350 domain-containing protein [Candidatus Poribacteria bacterium]
MAKRFVRRAMALSIFIVAAAAAYATGDGAIAMDMDGSGMGMFGPDLWKGLVHSVIYSLLGLVVLMVSFKVFDMITPFDLNKEIAEDDNTAAGVAVAGIMIGLGLIVAAAIAF